MNRALTCVVLLTVIGTYTATFVRAGESGPLKISEDVTLKVPEGYEWEELTLGLKKAPNSSELQYIVKLKDGDPPIKALVRVIDRSASTQEERKAEVDHYFDYLDSMFRAGPKGWQAVRRDRPEKYERLSHCTISSKHSSGAKGYYKALIVFGKKTVIIHCCDSVERIAELNLEVLETSLSLAKE